jgi:hypothetical protein
MYDFGEQDLLSHFATTNEFIEKGRKQGAVLVHW